MHWKVQNRLDNYNSKTFWTIEILWRRFNRLFQNHYIEFKKHKHYTPCFILIVALIIINLILLGLTINPLFFTVPFIFPFILGEVVEVGFKDGQLNTKDRVDASRFGNDINAIQEAIDFAITEGIPIVYVPEGTWVGGTNDVLTIDGSGASIYGFKFEGAGVGKTILDFSALNGAFDALTIDGGGVNRVYDCILSDFLIQGSINCRSGIKCNHAQMLKIDKVKVKDFLFVNADWSEAGIFLDNCYSGYLFDVEANGNYNGLVADTCNAIHIIGGKALSNGYTGVRSTTSQAFCVQGFALEQNGYFGMISATSFDTEIFNCYFEGNSNGDIFFLGSKSGVTAFYAMNNVARNCYFNGMKAEFRTLHMELSSEVVRDVR